MPWRRSVGFVVVAITCACNAVFGIDERPPQRGETISEGGFGGTLTCGAICDDDLPEGWSGPTVVMTGDGQPLGCDSQPDAPNAELTLFNELVAPASTCGCECAAATGINCNQSPVTVHTFFAGDCTNNNEVGSGVLGQCIDLCCSAQTAYFDPAVPDVTLASCMPTTQADVPAISWAASLVGCGPAPRESCGGQSCFIGSASALCIYRTGEHDCPSGPFQTRSVWYDDHEDTRTCEPCTCGAVTAVCNEVVEGYAINNCSVQPGPILPVGNCSGSPGDFDSAKVISVNPTGSCTPSAGVAMGAAAATAPTTICCAN